MNYYEVEFEDGYSICIRGERVPTIQEVEEFCANDIEKLDLGKVIAVLGITAEEAHTFFDMEHEDKFPVFGRY